MTNRSRDHDTSCYELCKISVRPLASQSDVNLTWRVEALSEALLLSDPAPFRLGSSSTNALWPVRHCLSTATCGGYSKHVLSKHLPRIRQLLENPTPPQGGVLWLPITRLRVPSTSVKDTMRSPSKGHHAREFQESNISGRSGWHYSCEHCQNRYVTVSYGIWGEEIGSRFWSRCSFRHPVPPGAMCLRLSIHEAAISAFQSSEVVAYPDAAKEPSNRTFSTCIGHGLLK